MILQPWFGSPQAATVQAACEKDASTLPLPSIVLAKAARIHSPTHRASCCSAAHADYAESAPACASTAPRPSGLLQSWLCRPSRQLRQALSLSFTPFPCSRGAAWSSLAVVLNVLTPSQRCQNLMAPGSPGQKKTAPKLEARQSVHSVHAVHAVHCASVRKHKGCTSEGTGAGEVGEFAEAKHRQVTSSRRNCPR